MVSISGTGPTADRNGPLVVSVMVTMSSHLNLNFLKINSSSNVIIKRRGSVPENVVPSQHSYRSKTYKSSHFHPAFRLLKLTKMSE